MSIKVNARVRRRDERAGDPLDGLVNMFDVGLVLAVGFLLAALQSVNLTSLLTAKDVTVVTRSEGKDTITVRRGDEIKSLDVQGGKVAGQGERVGEVYRLADGRLVYVDRANP
ncbi:MAG: DUF2149 domain-containing protein [Solirubrobacteraceae bacterium]|nr:DUF2149 domain-containing protein [Solirubrobacteraceae bacterium]